MNHKQIMQLHRWVALLALLSSGCADYDGSVANESETTAEAEQGWYSTNPYDQHGKMTYAAKNAASGYGVTWDCRRRNYLFFYGYSGQLCDGNVATDNSSSGSNAQFFTALWGARAHSNNHHFLRDGAESLDSACGNSVADLYAGTMTALSWRASGNEAAFQRAIGVVTHIIQDSFAPAHTRRDPNSPNYRNLLDVCSIYQDVPGACRHPEPLFPQEADDADDNPTLASQAINATIDYLVAVAKVATNQDPNALGPALEKWTQCPAPM